MSIKGKILEEVWSGTKISVSHLNFFGCVTFQHILEESRKKLVKMSEICIFTAAMNMTWLTSCITLSPRRL